MSTVLSCGHICAEHGKSPNGQTYCYPCCARMDREQMKLEGSITLYLSHRDNPDPPAATRWEVTNWPGTLKITPNRVKKSGHNMATRWDVWFIFEGYLWHGINIGDNELLRCKRTKQAAR